MRFLSRPDRANAAIAGTSDASRKVVDSVISATQWRRLRCSGTYCVLGPAYNQTPHQKTPKRLSEGKRDPLGVHPHHASGQLVLTKNACQTGESFRPTLAIVKGRELARLLRQPAFGCVFFVVQTLLPPRSDNKGSDISHNTRSL